MNCETNGCEGETRGIHCARCLAQLKRQEPRIETIMDGKGPRGM